MSMYNEKHGEIREGAEYILVSENIFTAKENETIDGFVAIRGNQIIAVGKREDQKKWMDKDTVVYDLGKKLVTPGYVDNHTFFTGNVLKTIGVNMSAAKTMVEALVILKQYAASLPEDKAILGHSWNPCGWEEDKPSTKELDAIFPDRPVVVFNEDREDCWMNRCAIEKYKFTREKLNSEELWRLFKEYLNDKKFIKEEYKKYMKMLNAQGITAIKEIGFDDFYDFLPVLEELETEKELTLRVNFVSQPVAEPINFVYAVEAKKKYNSDFLRFQGFNIMTDGSIGSFLGDLIEPYTNKPDTHNLSPVDYDTLEKIVVEGDKMGLKFGLHTQGDRAVRKSIDIYEKCRKINGERDARHVLTDLELTTPEDLERMGKLGVVAEVYPQIPSIYEEGKREKTVTFVGEERAKYYWNHRKMVDSGVKVTFATDLPLLLADIPESIYYASGKILKEDRKPFNPQNALTIAEVLKGWTIDGQYNNFAEEKLGTLEAGKYADIVVLDQNVFEVPMEKMCEVKVCLTISDGRVVYNTL